jgi:hypothetical protein
MPDQVAKLNNFRPAFQLNEPGAPCGGSSTCTDNVIKMIVEAETGRRISTRQIREAAAPSKPDCKGLNPAETLRALRHFGVNGYTGRVNCTASEAISATDRGIVLVAVGYDGYPTRAECEVGGKTDMNFMGAHAVSLWGRRMWKKEPAAFPDRIHFRPGWRVWLRDPDHPWGGRTPVYDRMLSKYLVRMMDALVGNGAWNCRFAIGRFPVNMSVKSRSFGAERPKQRMIKTTIEEPDGLENLPEFDSVPEADGE